MAKMEGFTQRQTIELTQSNPVLVRDQPLVKGDVQALVWIVTVKKNGVPVDLAGATASLYCARALSEDGSGGTTYSEAPTESGGTTYSEATIESGGTVKAVLPRDAANIPGPVGCMIRVTRDGASVAVARMAVMAVDLTGDDILDEGKRIPSLDEIAASIARCDAAAEKAEGAAASVGDALKQVASAIEAANDAASDARNAAGQATDGASAAKAAATTATEAATKIDDMTITATGLAAGTAPTAELTEVDGHYNIVLGLPKGDKGDPGATPQITVQVKTGEPGTAASVKQTGTAEAPVIELTIPRGDTGSIGSLTINGKAPDEAGKVMLTASDVGALSGTDATLTQAGKAADAKATGDELSQLKDEKVDKKIISDVFVQGKTYNPDDYCISDDKLWRCLVANSTKPTESENWAQTNVTAEIETLNGYNASNKSVNVRQIDTQTTDIVFNERPSNILIVAHGYSAYSNSVKDGCLYFVRLAVGDDTDIGYMLIKAPTETSGYLTLTGLSYNGSTNMMKVSWGSAGSRIVSNIPYY